MTSTEFTIGLEGCTRNSSKVLKPPGGGSSDIFGQGSRSISSNGYTNDYSRNETSKNTQNRLFGISNEPAATPARSQGISNEQAATPARSQMKSNIFENTQNNQVTVPKSAAKRYVRRNPITGEEIEYFPETNKKTETNGTEENDGTNGQNVSEQNAAVEEEKKTEVPRKPVQTSIRVRNPPGGKSSGIF